MSEPLTREGFAEFIRRVTDSWDRPRPNAIYLHPRESYKAWMMGNRRWAFRQWIRTMPIRWTILRDTPFSACRTWREWISDRPWQYGSF